MRRFSFEAGFDVDVLDQEMFKKGVMETRI